MNLWILVAMVCLAVVNLYVGYNAGVKDTEKRWSDAVARAEDSQQRRFR